MVIKITIEKISDAKADDGTSEMQTDIVFDGFERKSDEHFVNAQGSIRNKAQMFVAAVLEAFDE